MFSGFKGNGHLQPWCFLKNGWKLEICVFLEVEYSRLTCPLKNDGLGRCVFFWMAYFQGDMFHSRGGKLVKGRVVGKIFPKLWWFINGRKYVRSR